MSPFTHVLAGWIVSQPAESKRDRTLITLASVLPDVDGLSLLAGVEYYHTYHHTFGHSGLSGALYSLICACFSQQKARVFLLTFLSFHTHLLGDLLGSGDGWGIPYFWPLSDWSIMFSPPFQWELDAWQNVVATILMLIAIYFISLKKDRTIVEIISPKVDRSIVDVFQRWAKIIK